MNSGPMPARSVQRVPRGGGKACATTDICLKFVGFINPFR